MRQRRSVAGAIAAAVALVLAAAPSAVSSPHPGPAAVEAGGPVATVIARYRERIPELMAAQKVHGLAVALVDRDRALWVQGFGHRDAEGSGPVGVDTLFGVESMSKVFTATAVMQEVAASRLDLDAPITTYLPDFTVHSAFQSHPEQLITLRMLLSHTAGFTHEAPIGNNNDLNPGTFDAHVRSISDTWLRFPVGTGYAYSNLGIDLAGYILERVEGKPFAQVMHDSLLGPLGMDHSTFDRSMIRSTPDRAVGHTDPYPALPLDPMTAAGGLYASAADLARFLRFQLNDGSIYGRVVLASRSIQEMRTIPPPNTGAPAGYALGVGRTRWNRFPQRPDLFDHGGGGFGFLSDLWWLPQLGVGIAILTNSSDHDLQGDLALSILGDLVTAPGIYQDRLLRLPGRPPVTDGTSFEPPPGLSNMILATAMAPDAAQAARWASYTRSYRVPAWGLLDPLGQPGRFYVEASVPYLSIEDDTGTLVRHRLAEVQPGLFLADNGETLDLRGKHATWANLTLTPVTGGPTAWQWLLLGTAALLAAIWLLTAAARAIRRRHSPTVATHGPALAPRRHRVSAGLATLTALLMLGSVALIMVLPGLVDSGFLGWLLMPTALRLVLHLPLSLAVLSLITAAVVAWGWLRGWWPPRLRLQYATLATAAVTLASQMATWQLIGWGFT